MARHWPVHYRVPLQLSIDPVGLMPQKSIAAPAPALEHQQAAIRVFRRTAWLWLTKILFADKSGCDVGSDT
jgi:hypothetical protein